MAEQKTNGTSCFSNGVIWFGAGVSLAEILTGTYYGDMAFSEGLSAIILGHIIGGIMMYFAGLIGGRERVSAMETVKRSFGGDGARIFAVLNVLQLLGWTAIMTYDGAIAANGVLAAGVWFWALVIGGLIILWIYLGKTTLGKLGTISMAALLIMSAVLFGIIFFGGGSGLRTEAGSEAMSFGAAVELAVAMPLSWLPLISDYTRDAEKPAAATLTSVITYNLVSIFMYVIGMGAAMITGESDIAVIMMKAGLGILGLLIIVLSTVTTTFLDAFSAGVSSVTISEKLKEKPMAIMAAAIGTVAAMIYPMDNITDFLYLIGSVFAPMIAVQAADYFILKRSYADKKWNWTNVVIWVIGFLLYRYLMGVDTPVGSTLPDMLITMVLCVIAGKLTGKK